MNPAARYEAAQHRLELADAALVAAHQALEAAQRERWDANRACNDAEYELLRASEGIPAEPAPSASRETQQ